MLRDVAITRIQDGLGFRTDQSDRIALRLQEEQRDLERGKILPRFLLRLDQTLSLLSGSQTVSLPSDFLRRSPNSLRYLPTDGSSDVYQTIPWRTYDEAFATYSDWDAAGPKVAVLRVSDVYFFPEADVNYSVLWSYYRKDDVLTSNVENLWLANSPELLIGGAGRRIARDLRNKEAYQLFDEMYKMARVAWFNETVESENEAPLLLGANN